MTLAIAATDGTLADTLPVCFDAYRLAFAKYVAQERTDDQISALFGPSEEVVIRQAVPTRVEECLEDYLRHYDRCHERCPRPFAGIDALLARRVVARRFTEPRREPANVSDKEEVRPCKSA
jgi:phosphoglycolate phosphatase-like HAD superfamily hydrolase